MFHICGIPRKCMEKALDEAQKIVIFSRADVQQYLSFFKFGIFENAAPRVGERRVMGAVG